MTKQEQASPIREKSFEFAIRIVKLYKYLTTEKREFVLSKQIVRSGTSPGANIREAQNAESSADFIHKLSIAQKEIAETAYWLDLLFATGYLSQNEYESIQADCNQLLRITRSIILTKKKNLIAKTAAQTLLVLTATYGFLKLTLIGVV